MLGIVCDEIWLDLSSVLFFITMLFIADDFTRLYLYLQEILLTLWWHVSNSVFLTLWCGSNSFSVGKLHFGVNGRIFRFSKNKLQYNSNIGLIKHSQKEIVVFSALQFQRREATFLTPCIHFLLQNIRQPDLLEVLWFLLESTIPDCRAFKTG